MARVTLSGFQGSQESYAYIAEHPECFSQGTRMALAAMAASANDYMNADERDAAARMAGDEDALLQAHFAEEKARKLAEEQAAEDAAVAYEADRIEAEAAARAQELKPVCTLLALAPQASFVTALQSPPSALAFRKQIPPPPGVVFGSAASSSPTGSPLVSPAGSRGAGLACGASRCCVRCVDFQIGGTPSAYLGRWILGCYICSLRSSAAEVLTKSKLEISSGISTYVFYAEFYADSPVFPRFGKSARRGDYVRAAQLSKRWGETIANHLTAWLHFPAQKLRLSVPDDFVFTSHGFRSFAASLGVDHSLSVHNLMALANHKNAKSLEGYIAKNSKRRLEKNAEQLWTGVRK
jgi:hypothetical protein